MYKVPTISYVFLMKLLRKNLKLRPFPVIFG